MYSIFLKLLSIADFLYYSYTEIMKTFLTLSSRGGLTLPAKLRDSVGLSANDPVMAEITPQGILLRPVINLPLELYGPERVQEFDEAEEELASMIKQKSKKR
jgi:bifunctional DNA-binding transcriptional regulator/antitoxin component of YhaV-PrlF toxin-antitoxin module